MPLYSHSILSVKIPEANISAYGFIYWFLDVSLPGCYDDEKFCDKPNGGITCAIRCDGNTECADGSDEDEIDCKILSINVFYDFNHATVFIFIIAY